MTTGCGRRCRFCLPDLSPQMDLPKERIMAAVRANVRNGNKQISLATEDMFIWGQVHTDTPFYFPNREALLNLFAEVVHTPGVEQHFLSHSTMAPAVVDPLLIRKPLGAIAEQKPDSPAHVQHSSSEEDTVASDRPGNGLRSSRQKDHAGQSRAISNRGMAERIHPGIDHYEPQQLVSGGDSDDWESGRDG